MRLGLLAALPLLTGCASFQTRPLLGRANIEVATPLIASQAIQSVPVTMEEGRLIGSADFDVSATEDGCVRGQVNRTHLVICGEHVDDPARPPPLRRWRSMAGSSTSNYPINYTVELVDRGRALRVVVGPYEAQLQLGDDPTSDAIRAYPELAGALFAYQQVPNSKDGIYRVVADPSYLPPAPDAALVRRQLEAAYAGYAAACLRHDLAGVMARLAPDVVWTYPNGVTELRGQIEQTMKGFLASLGDGSSMVYHFQRVTVIDHKTAVADVALDTKVVLRDPADPSRGQEKRYTTWWHDTWKKGPAGWQNQIGLEEEKDPFPAPATTRQP